MTLLSFVIPCYRSEKTIEKVIDEIIAVVGQRDQYDYEIVAVNDCSPDHVYEVLKRLAEKNKKIKVINFAKNMGKHAAVLAGYAFVSGEYVINLDDDYQCPTYNLWEMIDPLEKDECDFVSAAYQVKRETFAKRIGSRFNAWINCVLLDKAKDIQFENFTAMKAFVAQEIVKYKNPYPYLAGLILRTTNRIKCIQMEERERQDGNKTGFTMKKSLSLFINGFTAFSVKPLRIASACGFIFSLIGFFFGVYIIIRRICNPAILLGYSSLISVLLLSSGLIMIMLGMIGEYIGRIYISINNSPQYVIRETININKNKTEKKNYRGVERNVEYS